MISTQTFFFEFCIIIIRFSFPGISPNFCLLWYQNFSSFFLLFGELTTDFNSKLEVGSRSNPSPHPSLPMIKSNPKKSIPCLRVKLRLKTLAPNPSIQRLQCNSTTVIHSCTKRTGAENPPPPPYKKMKLQNITFS